MLAAEAATVYSTDGEVLVTCNYEGLETPSEVSWVRVVSATETPVVEEADKVIFSHTPDGNNHKYVLNIKDANPEDNAGTCVEI